MKFLTKKLTTLISIHLFVLFGLIFSLELLCRDYSWNSGMVCKNVSNLYVIPEFFWVVLMALTATLVPIIFTLPLKSQVFEVWKHFWVWSAPIVVFLNAFWFYTLTGSWDNIALYIYLTLMYGIYFINSLVIIFTAWRKTKNGESMPVKDMYKLGLTSLIKSILILVILLTIYRYFGQ